MTTSHFSRLWLGALFALPLSLAAQLPRSPHAQDNLHFVDPFIGTTVSGVDTRWGNEGGVYPGAVAVSGFIQLSPETHPGGGGYDYRDSLIYVFSCTGHHSGFPGGSAGRFFVMPLTGDGGRPRSFSHQDEYASPGYYRVRLGDDGTLVEAVATPRAGVFRFTFPPGTTPRVFVGDTARAAFVFSERSIGEKTVPGGLIFTFPPTETLLLKVSASTVDAASARRNILLECDRPFDELLARVRAQWTQALSVVEVDDDDLAHKHIFYTALYHSLLAPWIISDVDGRYRGADGKVHRTATRKAYGNFSPWDTFRSLHPLLALLFPQKESEMAQSMLDVYRQCGRLPTESMTGNHSIPILVDDYVKGVPGIDKTLAYAAMTQSILKGPFAQKDMGIYRRTGYVPSGYPESVTRTLEYAYDDACLGWFAGKVMHDEGVRSLLDSAGRAYRLLFDPTSFLLLPRQGGAVQRSPGNSGYKEGDAWAYSFFVPQDPSGLIDLMGGGPLFAARLDSALRDGRIIFDNETVLQVPYLFNEAGFSYLTQQWVRTIMTHRYHATPGGLPGNDDLGAMSSWYVFSALGLFPACPGKPVYAIGSPLFRGIRLRLDNGKVWLIQTEHASDQNVYVQSLRVNGRPYRAASLSHGLLRKGGTIILDMGPTPGPALVPEDSRRPSFHLSAPTVSPYRVAAGEPFGVSFVVRNTGAEGTMQVRLWVDGRQVGSRNCCVGAGGTVRDSITCRLYRLGEATLRLDSAAADLVVAVLKPRRPLPSAPEVLALTIRPLIRMGDSLDGRVTLQNTGWETQTFAVPVLIDGLATYADTVPLEPGETRDVSLRLSIPAAGTHILRIGSLQQVFKVYREPVEACVLDLASDTTGAADRIKDRSGFGNDALVMGAASRAGPDGLLLGKDRYLDIPGSPSLSELGEALTMMLWVYPLEQGSGLVDIFTRGDFHVLQVAGGSSLTFFAGGWGRGDCTVALPADWVGHWHHIAGVCGPDGLRVYIDGELRGYTPMAATIPLSVAGPWTIGRNAEFPGQRIYKGYVDKPKVFQEALPADAVLSIFHSESNRASSTP